MPQPMFSTTTTSSSTPKPTTSADDSSQPNGRQAASETADKLADCAESRQNEGRDWAEQRATAAGHDPPELLTMRSPPEERQQGQQQGQVGQQGQERLSKEEADRLYEERIEEEYAKREGGA